jgi:hypothetical protein
MARYEIDIPSDEVQATLLPLLNMLAADGKISLRECSCAERKEDGVFAPWVDVERLVSVLNRDINLFIRSKREWVALFCAMRDLSMVHEDRRAWAERMNVLFPSANVECSYESIRKGCREPICKWDELDELYTLANSFLSTLQRAIAA